MCSMSVPVYTVCMEHKRHTIRKSEVGKINLCQVSVDVSTRRFCGVLKDDGSIPGKCCEILICSYLRHFINFNLSVGLPILLKVKLPRDVIYNVD